MREYYDKIESNDKYYDKEERKIINLQKIIDIDKENLLNILKVEGFNDKIITAFENVKREDFISDELKKYAYRNEPLPIGYGQTISQPSTIAFMIQELEVKDRIKILEIGSGSGYVLALLSLISKGSKIIGIERIKQLAEKSKKLLQKHFELNCKKFKEISDVNVIHGNGFHGLKSEAPFDRILVSASAPNIIPELVTQLNDNGVLVMPVGNSIVKIEKRNNHVFKKEYYGFVFVPLIDEPF